MTHRALDHQRRLRAIRVRHPRHLRAVRVRQVRWRADDRPFFAMSLRSGVQVFRCSGVQVDKDRPVSDVAVLTPEYLNTRTPERLTPPLPWSNSRLTPSGSSPRRRCPGAGPGSPDPARPPARPARSGPGASGCAGSSAIAAPAASCWVLIPIIVRSTFREASAISSSRCTCGFTPLATCARSVTNSNTRSSRASAPWRPSPRRRTAPRPLPPVAARRAAAQLHLDDRREAHPRSRSGSSTSTLRFPNVGRWP